MLGVAFIPKPGVRFIWE